MIKKGKLWKFIEFSSGWNGSSLILSGQIQPLQFARNHRTEDLERSFWDLSVKKTLWPLIQLLFVWLSVVLGHFWKRSYMHKNSFAGCYQKNASDIGDLLRKLASEPGQRILEPEVAVIATWLIGWQWLAELVDKRAIFVLDAQITRVCFI